MTVKVVTNIIASDRVTPPMIGNRAEFDPGGESSVKNKSPNIHPI